MKFHLVTGNTNSSDFNTHMSIHRTFIVEGYPQLLVKLVEYRIQSAEFDMEATGDDKWWFKKKFVRMMTGTSTLNSKNSLWKVVLLDAAKLVTDPKRAKKIIKAMEFERGEADPLVIVKENRYTRALLKYINNN